MKIYETLLLFALVCALAAVFVLWAKWEEEKVKTKEERDRRWDEISRAVGLENELERFKAREQCAARAVIWYSGELLKQITENAQMQDKLSALLCPMNDHVWKDGVCVKCGRVQDAEIH